MARPVQLWFQIERYFAALEEEIARVRRTVAAHGHGHDTEPGGPGSSAESKSGATGASLAAFTGFMEEGDQPADLVSVRARIRRRLTTLKAELAPHLTTRELYYALLPIVVTTDEKLRSAAGELVSHWEPLQSELYQFDNGGELFYEVLDTLISREETAPIVFEVFIFCLRDGFRGQLVDDEDRVANLVARLSTRLRVDAPSPVQREPYPQHPIHAVGFPWRAYALAGGVAGGLGLLLLLIASAL